jgi:hypothetical protein
MSGGLCEDMKRIFIGIAFIVLMNSIGVGDARSQVRYSTGAYSEVGADDTSLERLSDWWATIGMTEEEKAVIKSQRRAERKIREAQKNIIRKKKEIERIKRDQ